MNAFKKFDCVNLRFNSRSTLQISREILDTLEKLDSSKAGFNAISIILVNKKPIEYQIFYSYLENFAYDDEKTEKE